MAALNQNEMAALNQNVNKCCFECFVLVKYFVTKKSEFVTIKNIKIIK